jgi:hypothetical protein
MAPACPAEAGVGIRGIRNERPAALATGRDEACFRDIEEGPNMPDAAARDLATHAGEPGQPGSRGEADQERLGLVVERVGGHEVCRADLARMGEEEAGNARRRASSCDTRGPFSPVQVRIA